ncbi:ESX-4 secretion system protein eccD4 [Mycobacterium saskatchewanense]|uniref:Type VII secretion integral membrane protein EccD n=1 Tax=Mycobacterium saskatchewanense TaxID=220927 RepID=A0AAJ3NQB0_9MYCO|nr:type VII secretion integral membrane protein EccD [Mycobacterium saskatchewanense]BBX65417.1 ESX-4 secretion system protein eccD4 [Mycobacterium saskatchewanense]
MPASDPALRRVSVHADAAVVDLVLPAGVPMAVLMPSIVDALDVPARGEPRRYQLSQPGAPALDASTTLAANGIPDGAVLILAAPTEPVPGPTHEDAAEAVSTTLAAATRPWDRRQRRLTGAFAALLLTAAGGMALIRNAPSHNAIEAAGIAASAALATLLAAAVAGRAYRDQIAGLTLSLVATGFAAVAGTLVVPGAPGIPHALLAATAAAATSVVAARASGCGAVTLTATAGASIVVAVAALAGLITAAPLRTIGSVAALASLGLLGAAARVSIVLAGLSPRLPPEPGPGDLEPAAAGLAAKAVRADRWLAGLLAAFSSSTAVGAIVTVLAGGARPSCIAFGALTGALLLLRSRGNDATRTLVFATAGLAVVATTFGAAALHAPGNGAGVAGATAVLAAAAMCLGFVAPAIPASPVARRSGELLEWCATVAAVPLTGWICGLYGAVRGLAVQ